MFTFFVRLSKIVKLGKLSGRVDSGTNFELSSSQNMRTRLNFEQNTCTRKKNRLKHMDKIKLCVLLLPQSDFCIFTATFCLPYQI